MLELGQTILLGGKAPKKVATANLFLVDQAVIDEGRVDVGDAKRTEQYKVVIEQRVVVVVCVAKFN